MAKEIERKYLVVNDAYKHHAASSVVIRQGYLSVNPECTVRVRLYGDKAFLTVKSRNVGATRGEWEYEIPHADGVEMLGLCVSGLIEKVRYRVPAGDYVWEVDEFGGRHNGLVLAEIELPDEKAHYALPDFVGDEVTGDPRYYNSNLSKV